MEPDGGYHYEHRQDEVGAVSLAVGKVTRGLQQSALSNSPERKCDANPETYGHVRNKKASSRIARS